MNKAQCTISATSSGGTVGNTQIYVLVDANSGLIVAENSSGSFTTTAGLYRVYALNYDPSNAPSPLPTTLIGQDISLVGSSVVGCFNSDFLTDFVLQSCGECVQSNTITESDPLIATSSGGNAGNTQVYVLVNSGNSTIIATNSTGDFSGLISDGNNYEVYALNYDAAQPPSPLPVVGQQISSVGSTSQGCMNSDFFIDFVCFEVADPLPIELIEFNCELIENKRVFLNWRTASEINNDYFTIERTSNFTTWEEVVRIDGAGNSSQELRYQTWDLDPLFGASYYRLKQTDFDGKTSYSKMHPINRSGLVNVISAYPNPTKRFIRITAEPEGEFHLYNFIGQNLDQEISIIQNSANSLTIDLQRLSTGIYYLKSKESIVKIQKLPL